MRNKLSLLVLAVIVSTMALIGCGGGGGGANPVAPVAQAGDTANLSGQVLMSGQPLANAQVYLYKADKAHTAGIANIASIRAAMMPQEQIAEGSYTTASDQEGNYSFTNIPVGEYSLIAVKDETHQFAQTGIMLSTRAQTTIVNAQLTPTGKISGTVQVTRDGTTQNVGAAFVYVSGTSYVALTDSNGNFTLNNVPSNPSPAATYEIQVMAGLGMAAQSAVRVAPGQTTALGNISLSLSTQQTATINGSIAQGSMPALAIANKLVLLSGADRGVLGTYSDSSGNFSFFVKAVGTYQVRVVPEMPYVFNPNAQSALISALNTTVTVAPFNISKLDLPSGSMVSGTVTWGTLPTHPGYQFQGGEVLIRNAAFTRAEPVGSDGIYSIKGVPAGTYNVSLNPSINGFSSNVVSVTVVDGQNNPDINLTATYIAPFISTITFAGDIMSLSGGNFSKVAGQITGASANETPVPAYNSSTWSTPGNCQFDIANLAPGVYNLKLFNPASQTKSVPYNFTKNLGIPSNIVATATDVSAKIAWTNASFAQSTEIEFPANSGNILQASGNAFEFVKLTAGNSYSFRIRHKFNNSISSWVTANFSTKSTSVSNIPAFILPSPANFVSGSTPIFGFEVDNNQGYLAYIQGDLNILNIQSYNMVTRTTVASQSVPCLGGSDFFSMALNADGLYVTYDTSSGPTVGFYDRNLVPGPTKLLSDSPISIPTATMAKVKCFAGRVFLLSKDNTTSVRINEIDSSLDNSSLPSYSSSPTAGSGADLTYDSGNNTLYLAFNDSTQVPVKAFPGIALTPTPANVGSFPGMGPMRNFIASNGRLYAVQESSGPLGYYMDSGSGYSSPLDGSTAFVGFDKQHRIWMFNNVAPGYFFRYNEGLDKIASLKTLTTLYTINYTGLAKLDNVTGMMYLLHGGSAGALGIYQYDSNY